MGRLVEKGVVVTFERIRSEGPQSRHGTLFEVSIKHSPETGLGTRFVELLLPDDTSKKLRVVKDAGALGDQQLALQTVAKKLKLPLSRRPKKGL